jgi:hypothetical protein
MYFSSNFINEIKACDVTGSCNIFGVLRAALQNLGVKIQTGESV